jgi:ornithine decarboxylase
VFINDGVYGGLLEQIYGKITDQSANLSLPVRAWRGPRKLAGPTRPAVVFGPTCDSVDRLPAPLRLPVDLRIGDYLEFGVLGAYGSATATEFNGFRSRHYVRVEKGFHAERLPPASAA